MGKRKKKKKLFDLWQNEKNRIKKNKTSNPFPKQIHSMK